MIDACQAILEREAKLGRASLDDESTKIFHIYRFLCECENGGLSGFLYNISPKWMDISTLSSIVGALNHPELAQALSEVENIVANGPENFKGTWGGWLSQADPSVRLLELNETIATHYGELWDDLELLT